LAVRNADVEIGAAAPALAGCCGLKTCFGAVLAVAGGVGVEDADEAALGDEVDAGPAAAFAAGPMKSVAAVTASAMALRGYRGDLTAPFSLPGKPAPAPLMRPERHRMRDERESG
jgi:hypothetical protein